MALKAKLEDGLDTEGLSWEILLPEIYRRNTKFRFGPKGVSEVSFGATSVSEIGTKNFQERGLG